VTVGIANQSLVRTQGVVATAVNGTFLDSLKVSDMFLEPEGSVF
jgi:hypothetical protein